MKAPNTLILASSSLSRRSLLARLEIPFKSPSPDIDESPLPHEKPADLALRLAIAKAHVFKATYPDALIIGSDQVIFCGDERLDKPETIEAATQQLKLCSSNFIESYTAICLLNTRTGKIQSEVVYTKIYFRKLTDEIIHEYIRRDNPLHCAGSIKAEGLGMALFTKIETDDPTAILGLPLIALTTFLENENIAIF